ncbi:MAG TPA: S9 family peptidase [Acidimicrobiia bacterium]|nr:S9 family peptidase [Acidimicrobiia bacterium]
MTPPVAPRRPTTLRAHGDERVDDWFWLRNRDDPEVRSYLEAENTYTRKVMAPTEALQRQIFDEIKGRVQETDASAPVRKGPYEYFSRTVEGRQYGIQCRRPAGTPGLPDPFETPGSSPGEEVLLDQNVLAEGHDYFALGGFAVSPDHSRLAYSVDTSGGERYELRFRDLTTGDDLPDVIPDVYYGLAWANDDRTCFYVRPDAAMRPWQVWRHRLGTTATYDDLVYQEDDDRFYAGVGRTRTGRYVVIAVGSKITSESWFVDADEPREPPRVVEPRREGVEYDVEHHSSPERGDRFFVVTNDDGAENFKLMVTPVDQPARDHWREVVPHRDEVRLEGVDAFADHIVLSERAGGLERIVVRRFIDDESHVVAMPDPVYSAGVGANPEFDTGTLRFEYTSLVAPISSYDYDLEARERTLVKRQPVPGYDPDAYESHRMWATAPDGVRVPVSVVHRRRLAHDGTAPGLLYGYGSYEISIDPSFSAARVSLLERGVVFAIAHIRGGGELGRRWYEDGKLEHKPNTFTDFVACAEHLIAEGYVAPERLAARGGSAGGLLMGAVVNLRPDLFRAVVAEVPFVDSLTTILDETLPLTVTEWEEWGNPVADPEIYKVMKSYAPYDNVEAKDYPAMLVTGGLNDPRVSYWEPAKWVAKLRTTKTDDNPLLLKTEMGAGHAGPSGRYDAWRDEALVLAFLLTQLGAAPGVGVA